MSLLKMYPQNFFSAHCILSVISRAVLRAISAALVVVSFTASVVCTSLSLSSSENNNEDKCLLSLAQQTNTTDSETHT